MASAEPKLSAFSFAATPYWNLAEICICYISNRNRIVNGSATPN